MKLRYKILLLLIFYSLGIVAISGVAFYSLRQSMKIQSSLALGSRLQLESKEIKSLMKDIVFDLFQPDVYGQLRSLTYSPRSAVTISQWQEAVLQYKQTFGQFMKLSHFTKADDELIREQYLTAMMMNDKAMTKLNTMHELLLIIKEQYRYADNVYNAMLKDDSLVPFFSEFQETSYYFTNNFESFMNYFIESLREEAGRLEKSVIQAFSATALGFILLSILLTIYIAGDVRKKLLAVEDSFRQVSYGNFSAKIDISSNDEFGEFAETFSKSIQVLKQNVDNILNLTRDVGSFISERSDLQHLLDLVSMSVLQDTSADKVLIYKIDRDGDPTLAVEHGESLVSGEDEKLQNYLFSRIIRPNTYILMRKATKEDTEYSFTHIQSILAIPLVVDSGVFGLLVAIKTEPGSSFSDLGVTRLVTFAEYTSLTIDNFFKYSELIERRDAQYQALHSQVQPHFIYNVLGGILGLNRKGDSDGIIKTVDALKGMLRYIQSQNKWSVLEDEFTCIRQYCQLQQIRFGNRINFSFSCDDGAAHFRVPRLLLQPLVENAVIHGLEPLEEGGSLSVSAVSVRRRGEIGVDITVQDNGMGFDIEEAGKRENIGLMNVRQRIQIAFPNGTFDIDSKPGNGTVVSIRL